MKVSENGEFLQKDEHEHIEIINCQLKEYEIILDSIFREKNYSDIIVEGTYICESMIILLLKKENHSWKKSESIIRYASNTPLIPNKYKNILIFKIDKINKNVQQKKYISYKTVYTFLKSFENFISWFDHCYAERYNQSNLNIKKCISIIDSLPNNEPKHKKELPKRRNEKDYESDHIFRINETLKDLEKFISITSPENYIGPIIEGYRLCNLMLELFLKKEKFIIDDGCVIDNDQKIPINHYCIQKNLFPQECIEFLRLLEENDEFFRLDASYETTLSFLNALSYFIVWFNSYYSEKYGIQKPFNVNECYNAIHSLTNNEHEKTKKTLKAKKQKTMFTGNIDTLLSYPQPGTSDNLILMSLLTEIQEMKKSVQNTERNTLDMMSTLDEIRQEIKNISLQINSFQSLTEKQIRYAETEDEKNRLIAAFADECAERIVNQTNDSNLDNLHAEEKSKLIESLGDEAWNKLSENSKTFLISSKLMFHNLKDITEIIDYSGVCILVTKALEVEMHKRFFEEYLDYLFNKFRNNFSKYPTGLLHNRKPMRPEKFNLGSLAYILCLRFGKYDKNEDRLRNKQILIEYCKDRLFKESEKNMIEEKIEEYAKAIEKIREKFRNPSAHTNKIQKIDAEECFNIVLDVEKLLKKMLNSFEY